jgi:hypothetical protein
MRPRGTNGDRADGGWVHCPLPQVWDHRAGAGIVRRSATVAAGVGTEEPPELVSASSQITRISEETDNSIGIVPWPTCSKLVDR